MGYTDTFYTFPYLGKFTFSITPNFLQWGQVIVREFPPLVLGEEIIHLWQEVTLSLQITEKNLSMFVELEP